SRFIEYKVGVFAGCRGGDGPRDSISLQLVQELDKAVQRPYVGRINVAEQRLLFISVQGNFLGFQRAEEHRNPVLVRAAENSVSQIILRKMISVRLAELT